MNTIEIAAASVLGREHRRIDRPCQDAFAIRCGAGVTVAVVCDGCGSGAHSELGARLGAHVFARALGTRLEVGARVEDPDVWRAACDDLVARLGSLAPEVSIADHLLFTLLAAAITPVGSAVLAVGDGVIACDGDVRVIEAEGDAPPYLGYELVGTRVAIEPRCIDAREIVLATDGARPMFPELARPGDRYFANPDALRRRLWIASRDPDAGLFDDATVVALRSRAC
jgi:hypothetical protein